VSTLKRSGSRLSRGLYRVSTLKRSGCRLSRGQGVNSQEVRVSTLKRSGCQLSRGQGVDSVSVASIHQTNLNPDEKGAK